MDPALVDYCRVDYCRVGVYTHSFDNAIRAFKRFLTLDLTRRKLVLGDADSTTGWYEKTYEEETIEGLMFPKSAEQQALMAGTYVRRDYTLLTQDVVAEGDQIYTSGDGKYYEVESVEEHYEGDSFHCRSCQLTYLPFEEGG